MHRQGVEDVDYTALHAGQPPFIALSSESSFKIAGPILVSLNIVRFSRRLLIPGTGVSPTPKLRLTCATKVTQT
jgi:hypothetical protein